MTIAIHKGEKFFTHAADEVIWLRDEKHTPFNKRPSEVDSTLAVAVRAPIKADWINFNVEETTTTRNYNGGKDRTASRTISFCMSKEQFALVVAHVERSK